MYHNTSASSEVIFIESTAVGKTNKALLKIRI
jgi:hypothetical protein